VKTLKYWSLDVRCWILVSRLLQFTVSLQARRQKEAPSEPWGKSGAEATALHTLTRQPRGLRFREASGAAALRRFRTAASLQKGQPPSRRSGASVFALLRRERLARRKGGRVAHSKTWRQFGWFRKIPHNSAIGHWSYESRRSLWERWRLAGEFRFLTPRLAGGTPALPGGSERGTLR
jgi:hypothetical protein